MYPQNYFALFPPFPRKSKVFVAMSFDDRFTERYEKVIAPGIRQVLEKGVFLEPHRVDARRISDSVLTEILDGISNDILVLADVTSIGSVDGRAIRNGNVMYEIGLAHALRLPEEVLVVRSDSDPLLFDLANVRVNQFDPDGDPEGSKRWIAETIAESLNEVDQRRSLTVRRGAQSLDAKSWTLLMEAGMQKKGIQPSRSINMRDALSNVERNASILRLLDLGALQTIYASITPEQLASDESRLEELMEYKLTAFGEAVLLYAGEKVIGTSPDVHQMLSDMDRNGAKGGQL